MTAQASECASKWPGSCQGIDKQLAVHFQRSDADVASVSRVDGEHRAATKSGVTATATHHLPLPAAAKSAVTDLQADERMLAAWS